MRLSNRRTSLVICALGLLIAGCAPAVTAPAALAIGPAPTEAAITPEDLRLRLGILAHDSMRGRETGTPGIEKAAGYLEGEAARLGLRPAGDGGSYRHRVDLVRRRTEATVQVVGSPRAAALTQADILPVSGLGGLPSSTRREGEGPLVYVGHMVDPSVGDRELSEEQLAGAAVMVRLVRPEGVAEGTPPRARLAGLFGPESPVAAVILIVDAQTASFWTYASGLARTGSVERPGAEAGTSRPPFFLMDPAAAERLIGAPLADARAPRVDLGTFRYAVRETISRVEAWNIAAVLPGREAQRARQYIALGAHYDHVGVGTPVNGDSIYNGADDNASGTTTILEVAERLANLPAAQRPARSILFTWFTAEEVGLLGSAAFTERPTVERDSIVAHINMDMVGRNHPDSIFVVGSRRISTELGDAVEEVNRAQPRPFTLDYSYDAPNHPEMIYCRSDHYNFARYGIPITFFTTGLHEDYHAPSDSPERIDYEKIARVGRMVSDLTLALANRPTRPAVDQPVPPLGTPCT